MSVEFRPNSRLLRTIVASWTTWQAAAANTPISVVTISIVRSLN